MRNEHEDPDQTDADREELMDMGLDPNDPDVGELAPGGMDADAGDDDMGETEDIADDDADSEEEDFDEED